MKEIFEQYGGVLITVTAIVAVVAIVTVLIGTGEGSVVYDALNCTPCQGHFELV